MISGLLPAWSRALIVASAVLACVGAAVWFAPRSPHPPLRPAEPAVDGGVPVIPPRLNLPRRDPLQAADAGTFAAAFERGVAAYNADDVEGAADAFEEAVRLGPSEPEAHINLGLVYMRLQRPEDGLRELAAGAALDRARKTTEPAGGSDPGYGDGTIGTHDDSGRDGRR